MPGIVFEWRWRPPQTRENPPGNNKLIDYLVVPRCVGCRVVCGEETLQLLAIQPSGLLGLLDYSLMWRSRFHVLLGLALVVITGDVFGQVGGNDAHQGVLHKLW